MTDKTDEQRAIEYAKRTPFYTAHAAARQGYLAGLEMGRELDRQQARENQP